MQIPVDSRLVIAYNAHSSRAQALQAAVFDRLDDEGLMYTRVEILQAPLEENVEHLAGKFQPGDIVLCAAGDGSAHALIHALRAADQPNIQVGFLAFGNFNDLARTFNSKATLRDPIAFLQAAQIETLYPLEVRVNDAPFRRALLYVTIGWTAQAAHRFDEPDIRQKIQSGSANMPFNLWKIGLFYFSSRRTSVLPAFTLDARRRTRLTDILCVNGPRLARIFRTGRRYYRRRVFLYKKLNVRSLIWNIPFLIRSLLFAMPGKEKMQMDMDFDQPSSIPIQCDGEVAELTGVQSIQVRKSDSALSILSTRKSR